MSHGCLCFLTFFCNASRCVATCRSLWIKRRLWLAVHKHRGLQPARRPSKAPFLPTVDSYDHFSSGTPHWHLTWLAELWQQCQDNVTTASSCHSTQLRQRCTPRWFRMIITIYLLRKSSSPFAEIVQSTSAKASQPKRHGVVINKTPSAQCNCSAPRRQFHSCTQLCYHQERAHSRRETRHWPWIKSSQQNKGPFKFQLQQLRENLTRQQREFDVEWMDMQQQ